MSEYFTLRCDQCDVEADSVDINHGQELIQHAIDQREALVALYRAGFVSITDGLWHVPLDFLAEHEGHPLRARSEYTE